MKNLKAEELKLELIGKEMSFMELDDFMMEAGHYSVFGDGCTEDIKDSQNVVYTALGTCESEVLIHFVITIDSGEDEIKEAFYMQVTGVEEF